jgi:hypothetical protein
MLYAYPILLVAVPLWWRSRAARFAIVFCAVTWAAMAFTRDAGGAAHHAVLLWPFPQLFLAATLAQIPWRWLSGLACAVLVVMNLLVVEQYIYQFERDGAAGNFTDALFPLTETLSKRTAQPIYVLDWGIDVTVNLETSGHLMLRVANGPFMDDTPSQADRDIAGRMIADRDAVFVSHVAERESFPGVGRRADQMALGLGYRKQVLETIADSNGRPVFEVFRYRN